MSGWVNQCSNYHTSRVGRGPPTSLNGPLTLRKCRGPKGAAFGPPTCADPGGKNAERFLETTLKNVAAHIDVGYGFGLRKKLRIKTWKRSMTKKKMVVRNFGRIDEHFLGKNGKKIFRNARKKS